MQEVKRDGNASSPVTVYAASKTLAERAAWDFIEKEKPPFDLTAILPVFNFGPYIHEVRCKFGWTCALRRDSYVLRAGHKG